MKYEVETTIEAPRQKVVELYQDPEMHKKWQKGLLGMKHISGSPGSVGAKTELEYQMGKRKVRMIETIIESRFPDFFSGTYEANKVWNQVDNHFTEMDANTTHWKVVTEFKLKGAMKIMGALMPGAFKKQTRKFVQDFKAFAENQ